MDYKNIAAAILFFVVLLQAKAQVVFKPGFRGGFSFSNISEMNSDYKTDFYLGGFGEINIRKHYALQPEMTYIRQGANNLARIYYADDVKKVEYRDLQLGYVSFAMMNKFTFGPGIQLQFGPSLDILVNNNLVRRKTYNDAAILVGFAYCFPSGLSIEGRIKKGLYDVLESSYYNNDDSNNRIFGDYNRNVNFQFGIAYAFSEKK
ncbi:outer membrane beta-barrel protein [Flavobacterium sp. KJJ]|uniref:outer membrane beta-barrel protein n=1 Tax=Flavobacterium sp. KJJ TaxID=1270193 RepID=UPI0004933BBA|nr:outer membrane beta-barrel protein [Flavobacterium sp. KJJ]